MIFAYTCMHPIRIDILLVGAVKGREAVEQELGVADAKAEAIHGQ